MRGQVFTLHSELSELNANWDKEKINVITTVITHVLQRKHKNCM